MNLSLSLQGFRLTIFLFCISEQIIWLGDSNESSAIRQLFFKLNSLYCSHPRLLIQC